ncbi:hypothetical protein [Novosphingobium colocasiae]|uniref:hypothetical protein n=1 Tax=Novosphingobium colocasiae TaxID=1256513 RepID=UPI0035AEB155
MPFANRSRRMVALKQTRPRADLAPTLFAAWRDLWRCAPDEDRRDVIALIVGTPSMLAVFAIVWVMLP